ncbi:MAG TPA: Yip1 family protein, partial [Nitrospira sp.]
EWPVIESERTSTQALYTGYIMPLAAIGPVAMLIGMSMVGVQTPFMGTIRFPLSNLLSQMLVSYVLALAGIYVLSLIINALAPTFGGTSNQMQALKVAAYGATAAWVGGIFHLLPALGLLGLLAAFYTLYLVYLGLPVLMKSPPERSLGYTVAVVIAAIVLFVIVGAISAAFVGFPTTAIQTPEEKQATKNIEQLEKNLQSFTKNLEKAAQSPEGSRKNIDSPPSVEDAMNSASTVVQALNQAANGGKAVDPVDFRQLKELMPESLAGMSRAEAAGEKSTALGMTVSKAAARYAGDGQRSIDLTISDIGNVSGLAGLALYAWTNGEIDKDSQSGYEKTTVFQGYKAYEKYDKRDQRGELDVLVNKRFVVEAKGDRLSMEDLKGALSKVDLDKLARL